MAWTNHGKQKPGIEAYAETPFKEAEMGAMSHVFRAARQCAIVLAATIAATTPNPGRAEQTVDTVACAACQSFANRLALFGQGPAFLASYEARPEGDPLLPVLRDVAFVYDNALVIVALIGCGQISAATPIGDALLYAIDNDRHYRDGRLRNAYKAGPIEDLTKPAPMPGYRDEETGTWREDAYQAGTATGSTAWAALALLNLHRTTGETRYLDGAKRIMRWINTLTFDSHGPGGYRGGFYGFEPTPRRIGWKSTEHNIDVYAANRWLAETTGKGVWRRHAARALTFVAAAWSVHDAQFHIGTGSDGATWNREQTGLDAQLWPLIAAPQVVAKSDRAIDATLSGFGVDGGLDFNTDRDAAWLEGTAQGALVLKAFGRNDEARSMLRIVMENRVGDGLIYASSKDRLTTGLTTGPDSDAPEFFYFRLPHIGATAWAALAGTGWNPFTGRPLADIETEAAACRPKS